MLFRSATVSSAIRSFQFKFLHRIIYTKEKLFKWKIVDTNSCTFCDQETESILHLFWECDFVKIFWQQVFSHCKVNETVILNFDKTEVLLGTKNVKPVLNLIFILGKKYINACKYGNIIPNLYGFMNIVKKTKQIEKSIAQKKQKMEKHTTKWNMFEIIEFGDR